MPTALRFATPALQQALLAALRELPSLVIEADGTARFAAADWPTASAAAHAIRNAQFRWYLQRFDNEPQLRRFVELLQERQLPYELEYHDSGPWLLLPKSDGKLHEDLAGVVIDEGL